MHTKINNPQKGHPHALHRAAFFCIYTVSVLALITMDTTKTFQELSLTASITKQSTHLRIAVEKRMQKRIDKKKSLRPRKVIAKKIVLSEESDVSSPVQSSSVPAPLPVHTSAPISQQADVFPAFEHTVFPVSRAVRWGEMTSKSEWGRDYSQMTSADFTSIPRYNIVELQRPIEMLLKSRSQNEDLITAKLFYSTRHFGAYDLDSGEYVSRHAGVDLKMPAGTPVVSVAGGKVHAIGSEGTLGTHVIVEHRLNGTQYFSIYGHLGSTNVQVGDAVAPGTLLGTIGMTGNTSGAHLHFQVDRGNGSGQHVPYVPSSVPSAAKADLFTVHPIQFISEFAGL